VGTSVLTGEGVETAVSKLAELVELSMENGDARTVMGETTDSSTHSATLASELLPDDGEIQHRARPGVVSHSRWRQTFS
jgi:hypothetical protein